MIAACVAALGGCYQSHAVEDAGRRADGDPVGDGGLPDGHTGHECAAGEPCDCRAASVLPSGTHWVGVAVDRPSSNPFISPAHRVILSRTAWIATFEASTACYVRCIDAGACAEPELPEGLEDSSGWIFGSGYWRDDRWHDHPIVGLTWAQAAAYCSWLGGRLPTNAEWEKLVRGEDGRAVPWEEPPVDPAWPSDPSGIALCEYAHRPSFACSSHEPVTMVPIDSYGAGRGPYGHYNVVGNAAEWAADSLAVYDEDDRVDPLDDDASGERVIRSLFGPGWDRDTFEDFPRNHVPIGVRCAFDAEPAPFLAEE